MSEHLVEVRLRHMDETWSVRLTNWPIDDLDDLVRYIAAWGVMVDMNGPHEDPFGQFVVAEGTAYFEIVVGGEK